MNEPLQEVMSEPVGVRNETRRTRRHLLVSFVVLLVLGVLAYWAFRSAHRAAFRRERINSLKQIGLAIHNYHDVYEMLPPSEIRDAQGRVMASWRLRIGPFIEASGLWSCSRQNWSHPDSYAWLLIPPLVYCFGESVRKDPPFETNVVAVTGPGTALEANRSYSLADLPPKTVLAIEIKESGILWPEPRDLDIREVSESILAGIDGSGVLVLHADGSVGWVAKDMPVERFKALCTIEGGKDPYWHQSQRPG